LKEADQEEVVADKVVADKVVLEVYLQVHLVNQEFSLMIEQVSSMLCMELARAERSAKAICGSKRKAEYQPLLQIIK